MTMISVLYLAVLIAGIVGTILVVSSLVSMADSLASIAGSMKTLAEVAAW